MERKVKSLSRVQLFVTPWTVVYPVSPSMGFSRQEYWSGLPFPSPGDLPDPGIEPEFPALSADALPSEPPGKYTKTCMWIFIAALFIIAKTWKQPRCPSMSEWINKLQHDPLYYSMEYYLAHTTKKSSQTTYKHGEGTSLLQCLRLPTSAAGGKSSVPGQGTKILCAMRCTPPTTRNMEKM